jgi:hypothetical protein
MTNHTPPPWLLDDPSPDTIPPWIEAQLLAEPAPKPTSKPTSKTKFRLVAVNDALKRLPPRRWLVRGWLEPGQIALIHAAPNCGKSTLAADLGLSVACGRPWAGLKVRRGPVVFLPSEGRAGFLRRLDAWSIRHRMPIPNSVYIVEGEPVKLDGDGAGQVRDGFEALPEPPALVVIDTRRGHMQGRENESDDMDAFYRSLRGMLGDAAAIVLHHDRADGSGPRGSSAELADVDVAAHLVQKAGTVTLRCSKMRDAELPAPLRFRIEGVELGELDEDGEPVTAAVALHVEADEASEAACEDAAFPDLSANASAEDRGADAAAFLAEQQRQQERADAQVLAAMAKADEAGDWPSAKRTGPRAATSVLRWYGCELPNAEVWTVLDRLKATGLIAAVSYMTAKREPAQRLELTDAGRQRAGCRSSAGSASSEPAESAEPGAPVGLDAPEQGEPLRVPLPEFQNDPFPRDEREPAEPGTPATDPPSSNARGAAEGGEQQSSSLAAFHGIEAAGITMTANGTLRLAL